MLLNSSLRISAGVLTAAVLAIGLTACGSSYGGSSGGTPVAVTLNQSSLTDAPASVASGKTTFKVTNAGSEKHEFVVLKTDTPQDKLTPGADGTVSEDGKVNELDPFSPNATKTLTLTLKPGKYILLCNLPGHYQRGIHAALTVQ
ncbi:MAG: hypothetical protein ACYDCQ_09890 [Dehalococcoidia bacterium]